MVGTGYDGAHSLAFGADGTLYVAGMGTLFAVDLGPDLRERSRRAILDLPTGGAHTTRTVAVLPDGRLLVSVGSSCNACWEADARRAVILIADADGSNSRVFMRGLRNAVGVTVDPATGTPWATVNGRDLLGDDVPPETLYRIEDGADGGWPRCHAGTIVDPEFGSTADPATGKVGCDGVVTPAATFQAHMAPLGLAFWEGDAYIAFHGSWNRSTKVGYEVRRLPWSADGPAGPDEPFLSGFLDDASGDSSGRPAGVIVGRGWCALHLRRQGRRHLSGDADALDAKGPPVARRASSPRWCRGLRAPERGVGCLRRWRSPRAGWPGTVASSSPLMSARSTFWSPTSMR